MVRRILFVQLRQLDSGYPFFDLKLGTDRSPLYRSQLLRPNTRWEALVEIDNFRILLATYIFTIS